MSITNTAGNTIKSEADVIVDVDYADLMDGELVRKVGSFVVVDGKQYDYVVAFATPASDEQLEQFKEAVWGAITRLIEKHGAAH